MKRLLIAIAAATTLLAGPVMAQSAKFAASWDTETKTVSSLDTCTTTVCDNLADEDTLAVDMPLATLKIPEGKEILVSVSAEIGIYLVTQARGGKKDTGGTDATISSTAKAEGSVDVTLTLEASNGATCNIAPNDNVTLKSEMRELTVTGGGTMDIPTDQDFWIDVKITTDSIGAHHFEFLGVNCPQGDYTLTATFDLDTLAKATGDTSSAEAAVTLFDRIVTMQEVRAVKGSLASFD